jgi:hypothetical protein
MTSACHLLVPSRQPGSRLPTADEWSPIRSGEDQRDGNVSRARVRHPGESVQITGTSETTRIEAFSDGVFACRHHAAGARSEVAAPRRSCEEANYPSTSLRMTISRGVIPSRSEESGWWPSRGKPHRPDPSLRLGMTRSLVPLFFNFQFLIFNFLRPSPKTRRTPPR